MNRYTLCALLSAACSLLPATMSAQDTASVRPVVAALTAQVGGGQVRNTYLTPLLYGGTTWGVQYERSRALRWARWSGMQMLGASYAAASDRHDHSDMWTGRLCYRYAMHWAAHSRDGLPKRGDWRLMAGGYAGADAGFDYNLKLASSNNPVGARLTAGLGISAVGVWYYGRRAVPLMLHVQAPLVGTAFMPDYGASYYETFVLGTGADVMHFTSLHNQQDIDLRLSTDLPTPRHAIRLGCAYHVETMNINHLHTRYTSLAAVVGIVFGHVPFVRRSPAGIGDRDIVLPY